MSSNPSVGVIGLGRMGMGLAKSFARTGFDVYGFDSNAAATAGMDLEGITPSSLGTVARQPVIVSALPDGPDVRAAVGRVLEDASEGTLMIDCSTVDPAVTTEMAAAAADRGVRLRDAAMAGGPVDAAEGNLLFMVGCPENEFPEIESLLEPVSRAVVHCGDTGSGVALKVVNNLLALSIFLADVEALLLARSAGLDVEKAAQILNSTGAGNGAMTGLVLGQLLPREFAGAFRTSLAAKDVGIAVGMADRLGVSLQTMGATLETFNAAVEKGLGEHAAGAAGLVLEDAAGLSLAGNYEEELGT